MSELLKINVNEHTEKKNGLTYLSWAWAWAEVLKVDPQATWAPMFNGPQGNESPWFSLPDGSMLVGVSVAIKGHAKQCMLPVMDHRNKAIKNPDAFAVNTALMRCLAKCIAMHGLGLYIYAGEDLPEQEERPEPKKDKTEEFTSPLDKFSAVKQNHIRAAVGACVEKFDQGNAWGAYEEIVGVLSLIAKGNAEEETEVKLAINSLLRNKAALRNSLKEHFQAAREKETA